MAKVNPGRFREPVGAIEDGLCPWAPARHTQAGPPGRDGLARLLQPYETTFAAGLSQPDAIRATLAGGAATICSLMIGSCTPVLRGNLTRMITSAAAQQLILDRLNDAEDKFCIQSCERTPNRDYWIITANSEDWVLHGRGERCYVGVNAYLVNVATGALEIVGSGQSWQQYLQDKYDIEAAGAARYVLAPAFEFHDKRAVINLRQRLDCSLQVVREILSRDRAWFTGKLRVLKAAQKLLEERDIDSTIKLEQAPTQAAFLQDGRSDWETLKGMLRALPGG